MMHAIRIDRNKPLSGEPRCGHNRFYPDIEPVLEVGAGEEVVLETRDALDGQIKPTTTVADLKTLSTGVVHPLTGPVYVKGTQPGDVLEIEFLDIVAQPTGFSVIIPGVGILRDVITGPMWFTGASATAGRLPSRSPACASTAHLSWASPA